MKIEEKNLSDLIPNPKNPRSSSLTDENNLSRSLKKFGVVEPIVFNKRSGFIVGGHFRVRMLEKAGRKTAPCVVVDLSEDDEKELLIRLNANTGSWDYEKLKDWDSEDLDSWGLDVEGFDEVLEEPSYEDLIDENKNKPATLKITFESVEQLQKAEIDIHELIDRKYNGAFFSVSAGEL